VKTIGVLALQGDFAKHIAAVRAAGGQAREIRKGAVLEQIDGLIIPSGESTVIRKLLTRFCLMEPLKKFAALGKPVFGTCAGAILLSSHIEQYRQERMDLLDIQILRNGYGRQIESFETDISVPVLGEQPLRALFIRAPVITSVGKGVEVLAEFKGSPVLVRQGNVIAATFHPELTGDIRMHRYFLSLTAP
jgi:5'-phosphate synthase pdxT subunit